MPESTGVPINLGRGKVVFAPQGTRVAHAKRGNAHVTWVLLPDGSLHCVTPTGAVPLGIETKELVKKNLFNCT